jgi:hypothetical protein
MKKVLILTSLLNLFFVMAQAQKSDSDSTKESKAGKSSGLGIGIKAGLNFSNVTNASSINGHSQTGFHAGLFFGGSSKKILASRTELLFSQQGYSFSSGSVSGSNKLNYIMLVQLMAINITRFVQIQLGAQTGYLLNAKSDSGQSSTGNASADKILSLYSRFDYGFAGGLEIHPVAGLLVGARYSISLANLYKQPVDGSSGTGGVNFKNNVGQLFIGYRF